MKLNQAKPEFTRRGGWGLSDENVLKCVFVDYEGCWTGIP